MIRTDDIPTYVTLTTAQEVIDNLRCDVNLARMCEERDQAEQAETSDNEGYYLDNLQILHKQLDEIQDRIEMTLKCMNELEKDRKYMYLVGIHHPEWADQDYIRDRDEWVVSDSATSAINVWCHLRKGWLQQADYKMVKILDRKRVDTVQDQGIFAEEDDFMTEEQFEQFMDTAGEDECEDRISDNYLRKLEGEGK